MPKIEVVRPTDTVERRRRPLPLRTRAVLFLGGITAGTLTFGMGGAMGTAMSGDIHGSPKDIRECATVLDRTPDNVKLVEATCTTDMQQHYDFSLTAQRDENGRLVGYVYSPGTDALRDIAHDAQGEDNRLLFGFIAGGALLGAVGGAVVAPAFYSDEIRERFYAPDPSAV